MSTSPSAHKAVLFCDVAGSTRLFSQLGDVVARDLISKLLQDLVQIVDRHQGVLIKTIGDELMCGFDDADAGTKAAIAMQQLAQARRAVAQGIPLSIRIGIHCGPVIIENGDYFGDTVNLAARVAGAATIERILVSGAVAGSVQKSLASALRFRGKRVFKGISAEQQIYEVLWRQGTMMMSVASLAAPEKFEFALSTLTLRIGELSYVMEMGGNDLKIGRSPENNIVFSEAFVSSRHASIESWGGRFVLLDTSSNGTFVRHGDGSFVRVNGDIQLDGAGEISFGQLGTEAGAPVARFDTV